MRITASTSRRSRRAPMRWRVHSSRCWSIPWSDSSGPNTCSTASRSPAPASGDDAVRVALRQLRAARIGLQRTGASLATGPLLDFQLAHARARDAVHEPLDEARLIAELARLECPVVAIASAAENRQSY